MAAQQARRNDQRRSDARRVLAAVEADPAYYKPSPNTSTEVAGRIRSSLGITSQSGFNDPSLPEYNAPNGSAPNRYVKTRTTDSIGTGVAPWIEIKVDYKCNGNTFSTTASNGSNAVIVILEPFRKENNGNYYGTPYCINT